MRLLEGYQHKLGLSHGSHDERVGRYMIEPTWTSMNQLKTGRNWLAFLLLPICCSPMFVVGWRLSPQIPGFMDSIDRVIVRIWLFAAMFDEIHMFVSSDIMIIMSCFRIPISGCSGCLICHLWPRRRPASCLLRFLSRCHESFGYRMVWVNVEGPQKLVG